MYKRQDEDRETHDLEIELYDAQAALDKILRVAGRYKDVGTKDNPLTLSWKDFVKIEKDDITGTDSE